MDLSRYSSYEIDAPPSMSRFQIERFLVGTQPPTERYFTCCTEIRARLANIRGLDEKLSSCTTSEADASKVEILNRMLEATRRELDIFVELAEKWKPMTRGLGYEELQHQIWDERLCYRLCLAAISGAPLSTHVEEVMAMPEGSRVRRLFAFLVQGHDEEKQKLVDETMQHYETERPMIGVDDGHKD